MSPPPKPTVFSESNWNVDSPREVAEQGNKTAPMTIYRASKTLAEKGFLSKSLIPDIQNLMTTYFRSMGVRRSA